MSSTADEEYEYMIATAKEQEAVMKHFNITKKYYQDVYAYIYCWVCKDIISVKINKEDVRNGLQTGLYIHKYVHTNPDYDFDDSDDISNQKHTNNIFIDAKYDVRGVQTWLGIEPSSDDIESGTKIPITVKKIPPISVFLGMLSPNEFKILQLCDGNNSLPTVADIAGQSVEELEELLKKLKEKGLVNIVMRG